MHRRKALSTFARLPQALVLQQRLEQFQTALPIRRRRVVSFSQQQQPTHYRWASTNLAHVVVPHHDGSCEDSDERGMTALRDSLLRESQIKGKQLQAAVECIGWLADQAIENHKINNPHNAESMFRIATDLFDHVNQNTSDMTWTRGMYPRATTAYNHVLKAWKIIDGRSPETKLDDLKCIRNFPLNNVSYGIVMDAALESSSMPPEQLPEFCESVLRHMTLYPSKGIGDSKWPDADTFARCYEAFAKSNSLDASERAYTLFMTQKETAKVYRFTKMNDRCLMALLRSLQVAPRSGGYVSLSNQRLRLTYMEDVLQFASFQNTTGHASMEVYQLIVNAWLKHYAFGRKKHRNMSDVMDKVCTILKSCGNIYCRSDNVQNRSAMAHLLDQTLRVLVTSEPTILDLQRAESLYCEFVKSSGTFYVPSHDSLGSMVIVYTKQGRLQEAEHLVSTMVNQYHSEPKLHLYQELFHAWWEHGMSNKKNSSREDVAKSAEHAERIFFRVVELADSQQMAVVQLLAGRVIDLWAKSQRIHRIKSFLSKIESNALIKPNTPLLTHILRACAMQDLVPAEEAAEMADALLTRMHDLNLKGDPSVRPTNECYVLVIRAFGRTRQPTRIHKCLEVFNRLRSAYKTGLLGVQPSDELYFELLKAISKEGDASNAFRLLNQMLQDYEEGNVCAVPKIDTINMVLLTCLRSQDKEQAVSYGLKTYDLLIANESRFVLQANEKTYSILAELLEDGSVTTEAGSFTASLHIHRQTLARNMWNFRSSMSSKTPVQR